MPALEKPSVLVLALACLRSSAKRKIVMSTDGTLLSYTPLHNVHIKASIVSLVVSPALLLYVASPMLLIARKLFSSCIYVNHCVVSCLFLPCVSNLCEMLSNVG